MAAMMSTPIVDQIAALQTLESPALRSRWGEVFGRPPPKRMGRDLMLRALAYRVQEQAEGGLSKAAQKRLAGVTDPKKENSPRQKPPAIRLAPGARLVREWRGEMHHVTVHNDGFEYRRARYASLSHIAREITGTRWSGPLFFGLRKAATGDGGSAYGG